MEFHFETPFFIMQLIQKTTSIKSFHFQHLTDRISTAQYLTGHKYNLKKCVYVSSGKPYFRNQELHQESNS